MDEEIDKNLSLNISGPAMDVEGGYDLKYLVDTLGSLESIIEKTYLYSTGKSRMGEEDKENLKVILKNPRTGSFNAEIGIQLYSMALALSPLAIQNGPAIWKAIKNTYEYLKLVIDSKKKGETIMINNHKDGIQVVMIGNDNKPRTNIFPGYVEQLAERISPELEKMTKNIDENKLDSISFGDSINNDSITLSSVDKNRFATETYLTSNLYNLGGQIVIANSNSFTGKVLIFENDHGVEPGEYTFTVDPHLANKEFFKAKYLNDEEYTCRLKVRLDPSKGLQEIVVGINIVTTKKVA